MQTFGVALSKVETLLVTGTGDVISSQCRYSSKTHAMLKQKDGEIEQSINDCHFWWEDSDCASVCSVRGGLLGGAAPHVETDHPPMSVGNNDPPGLSHDRIGAAPDKDDESSPDPVSSDPAIGFEDDVDALTELPSFDYSYFTGEGNDMVLPHPMEPTLSPLVESPEGRSEHNLREQSRASDDTKLRVAPPVLLHGVPTFVPAFYQVRITQLSANPLGSHVLLISAEALLFSYGLNSNGQLGHGHKASYKTKGSSGFVTTPIIVTPLLENGGKAMACSAGVNYSLVVVMTEGRRIGRLQNHRPHHARSNSDAGLSFRMARVSSLPSRIYSEAGDEGPDDAVESMCHHQLYAFGRNNGGKLGLVNPGTGKQAQEDVLLPRRAALHCKVWPGTAESENNLAPPGIFSIAASANHSAALVRRTTGAVELYTWGDASFGALGPLFDSLTGSDAKTKQNRRLNGRFITPLPVTVTIPTLVQALSHDPDRPTSGQNDIPVQVALGPKSTFVISASGRCVSFGRSEVGLLGLGEGVTTSSSPGQVLFPSASNGAPPKIKSISVGAQHAVAVGSDGRVFAWGRNDGGMMGFDGKLRKHLSLRARRAAPQSSPTAQDMNEWIPRQVEIPAMHRPPTLKMKLLRKRSESPSINSEGPPPRADDKDKVVHACAGTDMTVFVTESGAVLSCGASSGRLGLGETSTEPVVTPKPMFGGLRLWI